MLTRFLILTAVLMTQAAAIQFAEHGSLVSRGLMRRMTVALPAAHVADGVRWKSTGVVPHKQIYTIPTYDAAFKWVLDQDDIRLSFLHAFADGLKIQSSKRIDENMNPVKGVQLLRDFVHQTKMLKIAHELQSNPSPYRVVKGKGLLVNDKATEFLRKMAKHFAHIKDFFPKAPYDGTMDLVCKLETGDYALVEMQVIPKNYWDRRALAYVAAFYGNQLSRGKDWKDIKKVIGINILGGGKDDISHWKDTPTEYVRHYKFEDQMNGKKGRYIDGIELIQYSIENAPTLKNREKQDWLTFFKKAHHMSEKDVKKNIKTPEVLKAFDRAKISNLPTEVRKSYEAEDKEYDRYSQHTDEQVKKGIAEVAKALMSKKMDDVFIVETTGLSLTEVQALRSSLPKS